MSRKVVICILQGLLVLQAGLSASPRISVDSADFDAGTVIEGESNSVSHTFILKNTGSSPLKINKVKASCGCIAVGYDSIIKPGAEGKVTQEINLDRISAGNFRKYITVFSNAQNDSILRLSLAGTLKPLMEIRPNFIQMSSNSGTGLHKTEVKIISTKKDLQISEVSFKSYNQAQSGPSWQSALPIFFEYKLSGPEEGSTKDDYSYNLTMWTKVADSQMQQGRFTIKTNHPQRPEFNVEGMLQ